MAASHPDGDWFWRLVAAGGDQVNVMVDQEHLRLAVAGDALDDFLQVLGFGFAHAGARFIEHHQLRVADQGLRNFGEVALFGRQVVALAVQPVRQADEVDRAEHRFLLGVTALEGRVVGNGLHVLEQGQVFGDLVGLERAPQPEGGTAMGCDAGQVLAVLDGRQLRLQTAQARAQLAKIERDYRRQVELHEKGLVAAGEN